MSSSLTAFLDRLKSDAPRLAEDFGAICATGGRLQGTASAEDAFDLVEVILGATGVGTLTSPTTRYHGWTLHEVGITVPGEREPVPSASLVGSVPTAGDGVSLEVLDLGRGAADDFAAAGDKVRGRAVLMRHEYAFSPDTIHRRVKLRAAAAAGAAAAVMVQPFEGFGPVAGGANSSPIPGFGVGIEGARRMLAAGRALFTLKAKHHPATARHLVLDIPGKGSGYVALTAHLDGHSLAKSAIDNAAGVAALLSLARAAAPFVADMRRGLRVCVFGAEEWSLSGSRAWLSQLPRSEVDGMAMNLNLDSVAGSPNLTALTSGYPALGEFVRGAAAEAGQELRVHLPISVSSDHANFAAYGVPAMRLIAGFGEPESRLARLLTAADVPDAVPAGELQRATEVAGAILWRALSASDDDMASLKTGSQSLEAAMAVLSPLPD